MGLAEKRIAATYQKETFPGWKTKITQVAGYDIGFEVGNWDAFVKEGFLDYYPNTIDFNYFMPLEKAFKAICSDDMGKQALKAKIKNVRITCNRAWSSLEVKVDGNTLHLDADPSYGREKDIVDDYTQRILTELEKAL